MPETASIPLIASNSGPSDAATSSKKKRILLGLGLLFLALVVTLVIVLFGSSDDLDDLWMYRIQSGTSVCLDGTSPVMYMRPGSSEKWVVYLHGFESCHGEKCESVPEVYPYLAGTSLDQEDVPFLDFLDSLGLQQRHGIISNDPALNPGWHDATHVVIRYCSQDVWIGNTSAGAASEDFPYHHQGSLILSDALHDLTSLYGLCESTEILYTGSSLSSARGVVFTADSTRAMLAEVCPQIDVRFTGLVDGAWLLDEEPYSTSTSANIPADGVDYDEQLDVWNAALPDACVAKQLYGDCNFFAEWYMDIVTPLFTVQNVYQWEPMGILGLPLTIDDENIDYVEAFADSFRSALSPYDSMVFSCSGHDTLTCEVFTDQVIPMEDGEMSAASGHMLWYENLWSHGSLVDTCLSYECNPTCIDCLADL